MCLSPRTITVRRKYYNELALDGELILQSRGFELHNSPRAKVLHIEVPCGRCSECLKRKRRELELRFYRESIVNPLMFFVTLTYRPTKLPVSLAYYVVEKETGEFYPLGQKGSVLAPRFDKEKLSCGIEVFRAEMLSNHKTYQNPSGWSHLDKMLYEDEDYIYISRCTPSLCRKDVQLWLKRSRMRYERRFGEKVHDFRYYIIGEHGFNTDRPHYHACFFGLPRKQLDFFLEEWRRDFGFVMSKQVNAKNKDGSSGFRLVGKYVAKYITKGNCESSCVNSGDVQKPRVMSSKSFGVGPVDEFLRNYHIGSRFFGKYDVSSLVKDDGVPLTSEQIEYLAQYVAEHLFVQLEGDNGNVYAFPIPAALRRRIFGVYKDELIYKNGLYETKKVFQGYSTIYLLAMEFARSNYLALLNSKSPQLEAYATAEDFGKAVAEFNANAEAVALAKEKAFHEAEVRLFQQSKL